MLRPTPLVSSSLVRSMVVGVVMWALLAGSLALAWGVTGASWRPPTAPPRVVVPIGGATLPLPGAWAMEGKSEAAGQPYVLWTFVNQASPAERMRVIRFSTTEPTDPGPVLGKLVLPQLVAGRMLKMSSDGPPLRYERGPSEGGEVIDLIFSTQRISNVATSPQLHAVRMLTPDRRNFWVFQLTNQVQAETWSRSLEIGHLEQLRRLLKDFAYEPESTE